ncbi:CDP-alcohol phosphatidyltransferase family protein [Fluviicola sp.]|uniref:CDP-alcohol phosphatidyltransferase family protein n=1 Tax=Fluviicola sp. TaxID=1917219 RepID=UPI0031D41DC5
MISVYNIKPKFQKLLRPVLVRLHAMGITANGITWAAIVLSFAVGGLFYWKPSGFMLIVLPVSLLVRMALNALDGMMAREYNMQSKKGELLNELGDVLADIAMFLPLVLLPGMHPLVLFAFVILGVVNEFTGVLAKAMTGQRRYDGPMGKSDRALLVGLTQLLLYFFPEIKVALNYIFGTGSLLLVISTAIRIKKTLA